VRIILRCFLSITIMLLIMFPPSFLSSNLLAEAGEIFNLIDRDRSDQSLLNMESVTVPKASFAEICLASNRPELPSKDRSQSSENWLDFVSRKLRGLLWGVTRGIQHPPLKSWLAELESHHLTRSEEVAVEVEPNTIS
jgi:hypothetical protein